MTRRAPWTNGNTPRACNEYATEAIERARIDLWDGKLPPLILFESRAAWDVSRNLCGRYLVPNAPSGGQCNGFLVKEIAPLLKGNQRRVLYVGDCELRGPADHPLAVGDKRMRWGLKTQ
jgi:hypothetical protein